MDRETKLLCQNVLISIPYYEAAQAGFYDTEIKMAKWT
jgi:hypothetical protein